jgi:hypothetical protein
MLGEMGPFEMGGRRVRVRVGSPTVLDGRQSVPQIVVIVYCMPIPKMPIKRA